MQSNIRGDVDEYFTENRGGFGILPTSPGNSNSAEKEDQINKNHNVQITNNRKKDFAPFSPQAYFEESKPIKFNLERSRQSSGDKLLRGWVTKEDPPGEQSSSFDHPDMKGGYLPQY